MPAIRNAPKSPHRKMLPVLIAAVGIGQGHAAHAGIPITDPTRAQDGVTAVLKFRQDCINDHDKGRVIDTKPDAPVKAACEVIMAGYPPATPTSSRESPNTAKPGQPTIPAPTK